MVNGSKTAANLERDYQLPSVKLGGYLLWQGPWNCISSIRLGKKYLLITGNKKNMGLFKYIRFACAVINWSKGLSTWYMSWLCISIRFRRVWGRSWPSYITNLRLIFLSSLIDTCVTAWLLLISLCIFVIFQEEFVIWLVFFFILLRCFQGLDDVRPATSQNEEAAMHQCQFPHPPNMATCILWATLYTVDALLQLSIYSASLLSLLFSDWV